MPNSSSRVSTLVPTCRVSSTSQLACPPHLARALVNLARCSPPACARATRELGVRELGRKEGRKEGRLDSGRLDQFRVRKSAEWGRLDQIRVRKQVERGQIRVDWTLMTMRLAFTRSCREKHSCPHPQVSNISADPTDIWANDCQIVGQTTQKFRGGG
eukprot:2202571-Rhodomonas_salina.1